MKDRINISSGASWEESVGYSRAVRIGSRIEVSGTVAADDSGPVGIGDPYRQAVFVLEKINEALQMAGSSLESVIRTRIYITNIEDWEAVARAHGEFFRDIRPATTLLVVKSLIMPELLVEIEAAAEVPSK